MTQAEALQRFPVGAAMSNAVGTFAVIARQRTCTTLTGCTEWTATTDWPRMNAWLTAGSGVTTPIPLQGGPIKFRLIGDSNGPLQIWANLGAAIGLEPAQQQPHCYGIGTPTVECDFRPSLTIGTTEVQVTPATLTNHCFRMKNVGRVPNTPDQTRFTSIETVLYATF